MASVAGATQTEDWNAAAIGVVPVLVDMGRPTVAGRPPLTVREASGVRPVGRDPGAERRAAAEVSGVVMSGA